MLRRRIAAVLSTLALGGAVLALQPAPTASAAGFVVSESQFNEMFPNRNSFYTYSGLTDALNAYPGFANTGSDTVKKAPPVIQGFAPGKTKGRPRIVVPIRRP